ncbi:MAG: hypothetical protein R3F34_04280 [Planctomycetota bacterium]
MSSNGAPTASVEPCSATLWPKRPPGIGTAGATRATCVHVPPGPSSNT